MPCSANTDTSLGTDYILFANTDLCNWMLLSISITFKELGMKQIT